MTFAEYCRFVVPQAGCALQELEGHVYFKGKQMTFSQYCRIETELGGLGAFNERKFIRAMRRMIAPQHRKFAWRGARHRFYREGFEMHRQAVAVYDACR